MKNKVMERIVGKQIGMKIITPKELKKLSKKTAQEIFDDLKKLDRKKKKKTKGFDPFYESDLLTQFEDLMKKKYGVKNG